MKVGSEEMWFKGEMYLGFCGVEGTMVCQSIRSQITILLACLCFHSGGRDFCSCISESLLP